MLGSMVYEDLSTTITPRYKFDATDANRLLGGWSGNDVGWNMDQIAGDTASTFSFWWMSDSDNGSQQDFLSVTYQAADNTSQLTVRFRYNDGDTIQAFLYQDSTLQWQLKTPADFLDNLVGTKNLFEINHDGTAPSLRHNGYPIANVSTVTATDVSVWIKGIATDATSKADYLSWGYLQDGGTIRQSKDDGEIADMLYWPLSLSESESADLYTLTVTNNGLPSYALNDPQRDSLAVEYPFEYDSAADTSGEENHGTISGATFANANTNGYFDFDGVNDSITSPQVKASAVTSYTFTAWCYRYIG